MDSKAELKHRFHKNPSVNPETGKKIQIGGAVYKLVKKYGIPPLATAKKTDVITTSTKRAKIHEAIEAIKQQEKR
jgi:hypothetical protein